MVPMSTRVTLSLFALLFAGLHPCLAVLPARSGCCCAGVGLQGDVSSLLLQGHAQGIQPGVFVAAFSQGGPWLWPCFGMSKMS